MSIRARVARWLPPALRHPAAARPRPTRLHLTALEDRSVPATFLVTSDDDTNTNGTLRKALTRLATEGEAENLIDIQVTDPITLADDLPDITKNVTIQGRGKGVTFLNGAGQFRPFTVSDGTDTVIEVTITGMAVTQSNETNSTLRKGGAIHNDGEDVTVRGVTFDTQNIGGDAGGVAFNNGGDLTLESCTLDNNRAADGGAVMSDGGTVTVTGCTFGPVFGNSATNLGGAISVKNAVLTVTGSRFVTNRSDVDAGAIAVIEEAGETATAAITNCEFDQNQAVNGAAGAVGVSGKAEVTITGSAFVLNTASDEGGGLAAADGAKVKVVNSTFGMNQADTGGAIYVLDGDTELTLRSTTLAFNTANQGAGLFVDPNGTPATPPDVLLVNTIVAKHANQDVNGVIDPASTGNVIGKAAGLGNNLDVLVAAGNKIGGVGMAPAEFDPDFDTDTPVFNGGPTKTLRIAAGGAAENAGSTNTAGNPAFDQRGTPFVRVAGGRIDAGAFEIQGALREYVVTTAEDRFAPGADPASLSLREALAAVSPDAPAIRFAAALNGQTITLTLGALTIDRDVTITGPGADQLTISGGGESRVFVITDGNDDVDKQVRISGLKLTRGNAGANGLGGAVHSFEAVTLDGVEVRDSTAFQGGGVATERGTLTIQNSTLVGNTSTAGGGGLEVMGFANQGDFTKLINTTVSGNKSTGNNAAGGGIDVFPGSKLQVFSSTIVGNEAKSADGQEGNGGGIFSNQGVVEIVGSIIANNVIGVTGEGPDLNGSSAKFKANFSLIESSPSGFEFETGFGVGIIAEDPDLGPLADNGGPTPTHLPAADSPAVTHTFTAAQVNPLDLTTDQRGTGFPRKAGDVTDLGAVELSPNTAPTISDVGNKTTTPGTAVGPIAFTVSDAETPAADLDPTFEVDNATLFPAGSIVFGGSGANRTVTLTPAAGKSGTATITLTVTDAGGLTDTDTFTVTVSDTPGDTTPPTLTPNPIPNVTAPAGQAITPVTLTVADNMSAAADIVVTATSGSTGLVGVAATGTGATRTLTFTPVSGQTGTATITVTAKDEANNVTTRTFTVTIGDGTDTTPPTITPDTLPNVSVTPGQAITPVTVTVADDASAAGAITVTATSSNTALVTAAVTGTGATRTVNLTPVAGQTGTATVTVTATDQQGNVTTRTFNVAISDRSRTLLVGVPPFGVGADVGSGQVIFYNPDKSVRFTADPFDGFTGGVRTAAGDFNADGVADLVVGTGPGRATRVLVLDGKTQAVLFDVAPFEAGFTGGVYVSAGDIDGDGKADLVITPDEGGGPRCDVYTGNGFGKVASFFGIDDPNFRGGARSAVADVNADGAGDLIVAAGFGGGPRVAGFSGKSLGSTPVKIFGDFFMFEQTLRNGVFITAGDVDGDGFADVIAGGGPGGGPRVFALSGKGLVDGNQQVQLANFFGGNPDSRGGIRVAVKDLDGDTRADVVVGAGAGAGSRVTGYLGTNIAANGTPAAQLDFDAFPGFAGGVFVG